MCTNFSEVVVSITQGLIDQIQKFLLPFDGRQICNLAVNTSYYFHDGNSRSFQKGFLSNGHLLIIILYVLRALLCLLKHSFIDDLIILNNFHHIFFHRKHFPSFNHHAHTHTRRKKKRDKTEVNGCQI